MLSQAMPIDAMLLIKITPAPPQRRRMSTYDKTISKMTPGDSLPKQ
jgi:hypothetical protein